MPWALLGEEILSLSLLFPLSGYAWGRAWRGDFVGIYLILALRACLGQAWKGDCVSIYVLILWACLGLERRFCGYLRDPHSLGIAWAWPGELFT